MIRLEHINLVVTNISKTKKFLETAMPHWKVRGSGQNEWYGKKRNWLHFGDDDYYITLNDHGEGQNRDLRGVLPGLAHIGFVVDNLDEIRDRLLERGYEIATIGADHPHRKTIYFIDPEGFEFEFIEYLSEIPSEKNMYGGELSDVKRISTK